MRLLLKQIFIFIIIIFSLILSFLSLTTTTTRAEGPGDIFFDPIENCIEGEKNMRAAEKDGKARVSNCRGNKSQLDVTMLNMTDTLIPLYPNDKPRATGALINFMVLMIANPPVSGLAYVHDVFQHAGLILTPVYAQGIGFAGLAPLLPLWKASRNIAYAILIIVMIVIGFMIIFRMKLDPKTVISIQAALPKVIITLLLITFSYPIAGFMIDLMYLTIFILIELISKAITPETLSSWGPWGAQFTTETARMQTELVKSGFTGWSNLFGSVFSFGMIPSFIQQGLSGSVVNIIGSAGIGGALGAILAKLAGAALVSAYIIPVILGAIFLVPLLIIFIIALGLFYVFIRLTFLLLNSYIQLLIAVILGPILLLKEAVPGQSAFGDWIKSIAANLIVFPATIGIIYLSWVITAIAWTSNLWGPPLIPVGGGGDLGGKGNPIALAIGLGIIFMSPNIVASFKKAFQVKPALPVTAGTAFSPVTGGAGALMGAASQYYYLSSLGERGLGKAIMDKAGNIFGRGGSKAKTGTPPS